MSDSAFFCCSSLALTWVSRNNSSDASALPQPCVQQDNNGNTIGTEDCLSMLLYVPTSISQGSDAPTFMWYVPRISIPVASR